MRDTTGIFIVYEGPEGAGKTTQALRLVKDLKERGLPAVYAREPGGTNVGEAVRGVLLDTKNAGMPPLTEFFLFQASRAAFMENVVRPALQRGEIVVADRFDLSTMAYQIGGRGLPERQCLEAIDLAVGGTHPDCYVVLMVDPEEGRRRQDASGKTADRIEAEARRFHRRVYNGYRRFSQLLPNAVVIDTTGKTLAGVHHEILQHLDHEFGELLAAV